MILTSVDLPAPLSPIRPTTSPGADRVVDLGERANGAELHADAAQLQKGHGEKLTWFAADQNRGF